MASDDLMEGAEEEDLDPDNPTASENNADPTRVNVDDIIGLDDQTNLEDNRTPADGTLPDNNQADPTSPKKDTSEIVQDNDQSGKLGEEVYRDTYQPDKIISDPDVASLKPRKNDTILPKPF